MKKLLSQLFRSVFYELLCKFSFSYKVPKQTLNPSNLPLLPARAGVCFRVVVVLGARRCRCRRCRCRCRLLVKSNMSGGLGYQLGHWNLARGLHARHRPGATKRRRGNPRQRRGGAPALWLAEGAGTRVPRCSNCCSPRTAPTPRRFSKLSVTAGSVTQVRPSAATGHQTAVTPRAGV